MLTDIIAEYGLNPEEYTIEKFGSGLINHTYKVSGVNHYILQRVNTHVFKIPDDINHNLTLLQNYLSANYPGYMFTAPLPATSGQCLVYTPQGHCYRLFNFVKASNTINQVETAGQAFEAASQFGKFARVLRDFNPATLKYTIPQFHDLNLRVKQFRLACTTASPERITKAGGSIEQAQTHSDIADTYNYIMQHNKVKLRVIHHDTKINNVLFDDNNKGLCVIDLDTVMPGYYISDTGDMMRTFLSPTNEEESDLSKIYIRKDILAAIHDGYMSEMGDVLTAEEYQYFTYSGKMMIYMQALRFLTDYLDNDAYYGAQYPEHNLVRAQNQFTLLNCYISATENA